MENSETSTSAKSAKALRGHEQRPIKVAGCGMTEGWRDEKKEREKECTKGYRTFQNWYPRAVAQI
jgi:hypothetical protein